MPQGLRGRVALFGAGIVCCSGLVGCMTDPAPKAPPVSRAKAGAATPPGARTMTPDIAGSRPVGGSGIPTGGGYQPGQVGQPAGGSAMPPAYPYNNGAIGGQVPSGVVGPGAPLPGQAPVAPSVLPATSNYPPAGNAIPPGYGSSNTPATPTTARAAAPTQTPPTPMLTEVPAPPPPPGGPLSVADTVPPTAPANIPGPLAPPPPFAPTASR